MAQIPGGTFWMGTTNDAMVDARPWHQVAISKFWIDKNVVTNTEFRAFVTATGYVTTAERVPIAKDFPGAAPENLVAGSAVFSAPSRPIALNDPLAWWKYVQGASWRYPQGPGSDLSGRDNHPVVQVSWYDATAYCQWRGQRLPTEAEFEFAARGGRDKNRFAWGNELRPGGRWMANIWQGHFPDGNAGEDGFVATSPVASFPANGYGLFDMAGNVWEWVSDWYRPDYYLAVAAGNSVVVNPQGPTDSFDPSEPSIAKRVMRGGSFLCTAHYCSGYEVGARGKGAPDTGTSHIGFRCARSSP